MSPRPYKLGQRQASTDQTRARILSAARELLMASQGFSGFSIEAVARQADVAANVFIVQHAVKAFDIYLSGRRLDQRRDNFRQRSLAGAVWTNQSEDFAFVNFEGYVAQRFNRRFEFSFQRLLQSQKRNGISL